MDRMLAQSFNIVRLPLFGSLTVRLGGPSAAPPRYRGQVRQSLRALLNWEAPADREAGVPIDVVTPRSGLLA